MDFIVGLFNMNKEYNANWVIVDQLTKGALFLTIKAKLSF